MRWRQRQLTKMPHFNPQDMANTVWAFAKAGHSAPALFDAVAAEALTKMPHFIPQDIANTVWAFATAMHSAPALFDAVAAEVLTKMPNFNPQDIANTVWAFATAGHSAPALFDAVAAAAVTKMPHFIPQGLADTVWAFATARYPHSQLFDAVLQRTVLSFHSHGLMPIELSRLLLSFAKIGHPGTPDLAAFVLAGLHQLDQSLLDSQHRANILYALALSGQLQAAQLRQIASPLEEQLTELLPEGARQIFQCCLAVRMEAGIADEPPGSTLLPPALYQAARNSWTASVEATSPSRLQKAVQRALRGMDLEPQSEVCTEDGLFSVDIMVEVEGRRVGVEVDGPTHFTCVEPYSVLPATALRQRLLVGAQRCDAVVSVPFFEWRSRRGAAKERYLREKLAAALV